MTKKPKRKNLKPPGKCIFCGGDTLTKEHVWAEGRYSRQEWKPRYLHNTLFVAKEDTAGLKDDRIYPPNTQNTTWIVGDIFTHSLSSSLRGALRRWNFPMSVRSALLQIWPVKTNHDWPPVRIMTDADAETAGTALFRRALSLMEMRNRFRGDT